jgi:hypothetical protein
MKTYKIGKIEVLGFDLPSQTQNEVTYHQAWEGMASSEYRHGWRMPTIEEMKYLLMFQWRYNVLGVNVDRPYWTSEYDTQGATAFVVFLEKTRIVNLGKKLPVHVPSNTLISNRTSMYNLYPVRFVRDI